MCPDAPSSVTYSVTASPTNSFSTFDSSTKVLDWSKSTSSDIGLYSFKLTATLSNIQDLFMTIPVNIILKITCPSATIASSGTTLQAYDYKVSTA